MRTFAGGLIVVVAISALVWIGREMARLDAAYYNRPCYVHAAKTYDKSKDGWFDHYLKDTCASMEKP